MNTIHAPKPEVLVRTAIRQAGFKETDEATLVRHALHSSLMAVVGFLLGLGSLWFIVRVPELTAHKATFSVFLLCVAVVFVAVGVFYTAMLPLLASAIHNKVEAIEAETHRMEQQAELQRERERAEKAQVFIIQLSDIFAEASAKDPAECSDIVKRQNPQVQAMRQELVDA